MNIPVSSPSRGKYRPHWATLVFLLPVALVLSLCNLAEEDSPDLYGDGNFGPGFYVGRLTWQGWPSRCLLREALLDDATGNYHYSTWQLWTGVVEFRPLIGAANLGIACLLLAIAGIGIETWLRRRETTRWWSLRLFDVMAASFVISIALATVEWHRREHRRELAIVRRLDAQQYPPSISWQSSKLSWQRHLKNALGIRAFDRAVEISVVDSELLGYVAQLRKVKTIDLSMADPSNLQLAELEQLQGLEALTMVAPNGYPPEVTKPVVELPHLPNIRGLNLWGAVFNGQGLENVPNLERFEATNTLLDDGDVEALCKLKRLRRLTVWGTKISDEGMARLRAALPECQID